MFFFQFLRHKIGSLWPLALIVLVLIYFIYHLIQGDHGLLAWRKLEVILGDTQNTLKNLETDYQKYEKRVYLLKNPHLDRDLLEEQAFQRLNLLSKEDRVVIIPVSADKEERPTK